MSRPQVTITLGRSGQVVKRAGNKLNERRFDHQPLSGSKRSIRQRLGANADNQLYGSQPNVKRQRGESNGNSNGAPDLRTKLIQKNKNRQLRDDIDLKNLKSLRGSISRTTQSPLSTYPVQRVPHTKVDDSLRAIPPTRSADDLLQLNSMRKSYSCLTHDGLRHRSPDNIIRASRGFSPPRVINSKHQVLAYRPVEGSSGSPYVGRDVYNYAGTKSPGPYLVRKTVPFEAIRPVPRQHPQSSRLQKSSYLGQELLTVGKFLDSLGLGKYAVLFQAEEIDMTVLKQMRDNDLKEMGLPMGPRRKILLSLLSLSRPV